MKLKALDHDIQSTVDLVDRIESLTKTLLNKVANGKNVSKTIGGLRVSARGINYLCFCGCATKKNLKILQSNDLLYFACSKAIKQLKKERIRFKIEE